MSNQNERRNRYGMVERFGAWVLHALRVDLGARLYEVELSAPRELRRTWKFTRLARACGWAAYVWRYRALPRAQGLNEDEVWAHMSDQERAAVLAYERDELAHDEEARLAWERERRAHMEQQEAHA